MLRFVLIALFAVAACRSEPDPSEMAMSARSRVLLERGTELLAQYRFEEALAAADSALVEQPDLPDAHFLRGRIYSEMLKLDEAEAAYLKVHDLNPDYRGVWHNLGNLASRQNDYRLAIRYYRRELQSHPAPAPWQSMGRAYQELGIADSAMFAYERALAVDSTYARTHVDIAMLLDEEGEYERALPYAKRAVALAPADANVRYVLGSLLVKLGRFDAAMEHLQHVAEVWPWHEGAAYNLGRAMAGMGREEEARAHLDRAEELRALQASVEQARAVVTHSPDDPYAHAQLGALLRRAGQYDEAMHAYRVALHLNPDNPDFLNNMSVVQLLQGRPDQAIGTLQKVLRRQPDFVAGWINLGIFFAQSGKEAEAREAWHSALRHDPDNEAALAYLARIDSSP